MTAPERGTRVGVVLSYLVALTVFALSAVNVVGLVYAVPHASADPCSDVDVSFARGRKEPVGLGRVGGEFVDSLTPRIQATGASLNVYPVNYDAGIFSAGGGANDLSNHLQSVAASCPRTKFVIGGYSMGAEVIDTIIGVPNVGIGFNRPLPAPVGDRVVAIATFGNATHRTGGPLSGIAGVFGSRAIDLCNQGDPICMAGPNNSWDAHTSYERTGLPAEAAAFVASKLNRHGEAESAE